MPEFRCGDRVRFVDTPEAMKEHCHAPQFYPMPGTVGIARGKHNLPAGGSSSVALRFRQRA